MTIDEVLDIEAIKNIRILGSHYLDSGQLKSLVDLYTDDAVCEFGPYGTWSDRNAFLDNFREAEAPFYASGYFSNLHVIANHSVTLEGGNSASGIVYLLDFVTGDMMRENGNPLYWLGVYEEDYRKVFGEWKIAKQRLNFVWPERLLNEGFPDRYIPSVRT